MGGLGVGGEGLHLLMMMLLLMLLRLQQRGMDGGCIELLGGM